MNLHSFRTGALELPTGCSLPEETALEHSMPESEVQWELAAGGVRIGEDESARERELTLTLLISKLFRHETLHRLEDKATS